SNFGNARCTTNGIEYSRLLMLLAVLTKRVGLAVGNTMSMPMSLEVSPWRNRPLTWASLPLLPQVIERNIFPPTWYSLEKWDSPVSYEPWAAWLCAYAKPPNSVSNVASYQAQAREPRYVLNSKMPVYPAISKSSLLARLQLH